MWVKFIFCVSEQVAKVEERPMEVVMMLLFRCILHQQTHTVTTFIRRLIYSIYFRLRCFIIIVVVDCYTYFHSIYHFSARDFHRCYLLILKNWIADFIFIIENSKIEALDNQLRWLLRFEWFVLWNLFKSLWLDRRMSVGRCKLPAVANWGRAEQQSI